MTPAALKHLSTADPVMRRIIREIGRCELVPETRRPPFQSLVMAVAHQQAVGIDIALRGAAIIAVGIGDGQGGTIFEAKQQRIPDPFVDGGGRWASEAHGLHHSLKPGGAFGWEGGEEVVIETENLAADGRAFKLGGRLKGKEESPAVFSADECGRYLGDFVRVAPGLVDGVVGDGEADGITHFGEVAPDGAFGAGPVAGQLAGDDFPTLGKQPVEF